MHQRSAFLNARPHTSSVNGTSVYYSWHGEGKERRRGETEKENPKAV
jgi:hypothetical protein